MPSLKKPRKEKKTFSLSRESILYLESVRKQRKRNSISSVLEELIRQEQSAREMERISASVTSYYDSITDEEREENRAWGQFSETQFPTEE
jgi:hypothetical protein